MKCKRCLTNSMVVDSRPSKLSFIMVRRRRECQTCGYRFTTYEIDAKQFEAMNDILKEAELNLEWGKD